MRIIPIGYLFAKYRVWDGKRLIYRQFLEERDREDLQQSVERGVEREALLHDGDEDVDGYGDPQLRLHCTFRGTVEPLDAQMLLDPREEQLDLPAAFVELADGDGRQGEMVGDENELLAGFAVVEANTAEVLGIAAPGLGTVERDGLVADDAGGTIGGRRVDAVRIHVRLGAGDEEGAGLVEDMQAIEIDVAAIHD